MDEYGDHTAHFTDYASSRWTSEWAALSVARSDLLLAAVGVPESIAANPAALHEAARDQLLAELNVRQRPGQPTRTTYAALLHATFSRIAEAYGEDAAGALYAWPRQPAGAQPRRRRAIG